jgi:hypothetical protein
MTDGFYECANALASSLFDVRTKYGVQSESYEQELCAVPKELHEQSGEPVINRLRELGIQKHSRIWWYATSVFCSLPPHAMGPVLSTGTHDQYFSDLYICSYTPTLGALIYARGLAIKSELGHSLLSVRGSTGPSVRAENVQLTLYISSIPAAKILLGKATREIVFDGLQPNRVAHFVCGSRREEGRPFDTVLELDEGHRLTLLAIVRSRVPIAELAVLPADRTVELVDGTDFVEGLHLTAAMQYYGFRGVVGAMWDFGRWRRGPLGDAEDNAPLAGKSAMALRHTVQELREERVPLNDGRIGFTMTFDTTCFEGVDSLTSHSFILPDCDSPRASSYDRSKQGQPDSRQLPRQHGDVPRALEHMIFLWNKCGFKFGYCRCRWKHI